MPTRPEGHSHGNGRLYARCMECDHHSLNSEDNWNCSNCDSPMHEVPAGCLRCHPEPMAWEEFTNGIVPGYIEVAMPADPVVTVSVQDLIGRRDLYNGADIQAQTAACDQTVRLQAEDQYIPSFSDILDAMNRASRNQQDGIVEVPGRKDDPVPGLD
jgi:hypothetical protein